MGNHLRQSVTNVFNAFKTNYSWKVFAFGNLLDEKQDGVGDGSGGEWKRWKLPYTIHVLMCVCVCAQKKCINKILDKDGWHSIGNNNNNNNSNSGINGAVCHKNLEQNEKHSHK